jgi:hypothetical protein
LLELDLAEESAVDCANCNMTPAVSGAGPDKLWAFNPKTRCCTFNPILPNYLAGQALLRGGQSEAVVKARLTSRVGVTPMGIIPPKSWITLYQRVRRREYGRSERLLCPYWVGGEFACGVWKDRNHVCRTWFCRHDHGAAGREAWKTVKGTLSVAEQLLAVFCVREGRAPPKRRSRKQFARWYRWCARRVAEVGDEDIAKLRRHPALVERLEEVAALAVSPPKPIPDMVVTSVAGVENDGDKVWVFGYSRFDGLLLPRSIFLFFSKLDGQRSWSQALAETNSEAAEPLDESVVHELYRIGGVRSPEPGDIPGLGDDEPTFELTEDGFYFRALMP